MPSIFISYRRNNSRVYAGRLHDRLTRHFGEGHVFMDMEGGIPGGDNFAEAIQRALASARAMLVVIDRQWLTCVDDTGNRRLDSPDDWVVREIRAAFARGILIVPVLVDGASLPRSEQLPEPLRALAAIQALEISDTRWDYDVGKIIEVLEGVESGPRASERVRRPAFVSRTVMGILAVGLISLLAWGLARFLPVERSSSEAVSAGVSGTTPTNNTLSFNTGWVFIGYYDTLRDAYIEGPYARVAFRPTGPERGVLVPSLGDVLRITKDRRVIVANFKAEGLRHQLTSPPLVHDVLTDVDETGVTLPADRLVVVRDIEMSGDSGRPSSVWCRVAECDSGIDGCARAAAELQNE